MPTSACPGTPAARGWVQDRTNPLSLPEGQTAFAAYGDPPDIAYAMPSPKGKAKVRLGIAAGGGALAARGTEGCKNSPRVFDPPPSKRGAPSQSR